MNKNHLILITAAFSLFSLVLYPSHALGTDTIDELLFLEPEKSISMDFSGASLNDVLKIFSQQSGLNFIAAADVASKTVNLDLEKVPVEKALERILSANNLTYEIDPESNIFVVQEQKSADMQLMSRIYPLRFATVPTSKLNTTLNFETDSSSTTETSTTVSENAGIIAAVQSVLSDSGSVVQDSRTNSLIVSDFPSQFPLIEQTIARLDVRVPQILIETEMLDISKNTADLFGAKFGQTPVSFTGAERSLLLPFNQNKAIRNLPKPGNQGFQFPDVGTEFTTGTLSFAGFTIALEFLRIQTDTRNLARPHIRTLNNETAEIAIKTDEAIGLASTTTSAEGTANTTAEAERVETGVFLKVTPQANTQTREITMAIEPRVIEAKPGETFNGQSFKDPEERGTKSILRINDGDTIIIGGLLRSELDDIKTRVPILSNIPVLGAPFRHTDKTENQRELVIFITPHIIDEVIAKQANSTDMWTMDREQTIPSDKKDLIDRELSLIEKQHFN
jgi:type IV pilus assembly protein PilQ